MLLPTMGQALLHPLTIKTILHRPIWCRKSIKWKKKKSLFRWLSSVKLTKLTNTYAYFYFLLWDRVSICRLGYHLTSSPSALDYCRVLGLQASMTPSLLLLSHTSYTIYYHRSPGFSKVSQSHPIETPSGTLVSALNLISWEDSPYSTCSVQINLYKPNFILYGGDTQWMKLQLE